MCGNYSVQLQSKANPKGKPREEIFADFAGLYEFVHNFSHNGQEAINVHLPACASDEERQRIRDFGLAAN